MSIPKKYPFPVPSNPAHPSPMTPPPTVPNFRPSCEASRRPPAVDQNAAALESPPPPLLETEAYAVQVASPDTIRETVEEILEAEREGSSLAVWCVTVPRPVVETLVTKGWSLKPIATSIKSHQLLYPAKYSGHYCPTLLDTEQIEASCLRSL